VDKLDLYRSMGNVIKQLNLGDVLACNEESKKYGLTLSVADAQAVIEARNQSISHNGRVELGIEAVKKMIAVFCQSPYINQDDYAETINELVDIFYSMKNETEDRIGDDELISIMYKCYNGSCKGSLDLLRNREMAIFAKYFRRMMQEQEYMLLQRSKKNEFQQY